MARKASTRCSDLHRRLLEEFAGQVGEGQPAYGEARKNVREEIVRCLWFGGHFPPDTPLTDDGRRLEVLSPGWWNVEGGPDFMRAEFLLEGSGRLVGDVDVHTVSSAWYAHGHDKQPEYNDVVLHVVMWNDTEGKETGLQSGEVVPQLTLSRFVEGELQELVEIVDMEEGATSGPPEAVPGRYCGRAGSAGRSKARKRSWRSPSAGHAEE